VWKQYVTIDPNAGPEMHIYANRYEKDQGWGTPEPIGTSGSAFYPDIAFDPSGNALAVWFKLDLSVAPDAFQVWSNRYTADEGWTSAEAISQYGNIIGTFEPEIWIDQNGDALAIWSRGVGQEVLINRFE